VVEGYSNNSISIWASSGRISALSAFGISQEIPHRAQQEGRQNRLPQGDEVFFVLHKEEENSSRWLLILVPVVVAVLGIAVLLS
jgi:hypothetical protein